ncbi:MAG: hypothetical protein JOZ24_13205 [Candidatus Eremiobacteraeota bacterium]|nr:hypothetical protein [Candidatus Eremiobacteraeota bacterium]
MIAPPRQRRRGGAAQTIVGFFVRLVLWAVVVGTAGRIAEAQWIAHGLDGVATLQPLHDLALRWYPAAIVVLAALGGPLRELGVFAGCFVAAAMLTAPFVLARLLHM